jgi:hypothetical protein
VPPDLETLISSFVVESSSKYPPPSMIVPASKPSKTMATPLTEDNLASVAFVSIPDSTEEWVQGDARFLGETSQL